MEDCVNLLDELSEKAVLVIGGGARGQDLSRTGSILPDRAHDQKHGRSQASCGI